MKVYAVSDTNGKVSLFKTLKEAKQELYNHYGKENIKYNEKHNGTRFFTWIPNEEQCLIQNCSLNLKKESLDEN